MDRSILSPEEAMATNFMGTGVLLEAAREFRPRRFMHISTDEVYGSIEPPAEADESYPLIASSPYSASKAGADLLALAYYATFGLPVIVTRASNNYGPYQFPEKLIPLMISNAFDGKPLPIYGDGRQVRDWLFVDDHCRAIPRRDRPRARRPGLQRRRQLRAAESGGRQAPVAGRRQAGIANDGGRRPPGPRPPLRPEQRQNRSRDRLEAPSRFRRRPGRHGSPGTATTAPGSTASAPANTALTTKRTTGTVNARGCLRARRRLPRLRGTSCARALRPRRG